MATSIFREPKREARTTIVRHAPAVLSTVLSLCFALTLWSQSLPSDFQTAHRERDRAMRKGDTKVYAHYTTDNFVVVMPDGSLQTKADRIGVMTKATIPEILGPTRDEKFVVSGETIVVNWISAIQGRDARFTEVWVKQGGFWKVTAAHVSMIPK